MCSLSFAPPPLLPSSQAVSCVQWSSDGLYIASSSVDGTIIVWEVSTQQSMARYKHPRGACITSIAWSPLGNELSYGGETYRDSTWGRRKEGG